MSTRSRSAAPTGSPSPRGMQRRDPRRRVDLDLAAAYRLAGLFNSLADPSRLRIVAALAGGELCVHELAEALELNQPAVSQQLRLLRDRGVVRPRRQGRHIYYRLDDEHVRELFERGRSHVMHR